MRRWLVALAVAVGAAATAQAAQLVQRRRAKPPEGVDLPGVTPANVRPPPKDDPRAMLRAGSDLVTLALKLPMLRAGNDLVTLALKLPR
jgi:hypothetical protein